MSSPIVRSPLTDEHLARLGITRAEADESAARVADYGPLTPEQRDRLVVLLRPPPPLARGA